MFENLKAVIGLARVKDEDLEAVMDFLRENMPCVG